MDVSHLILGRAPDARVAMDGSGLRNARLSTFAPDRFHLAGDVGAVMAAMERPGGEEARANRLRAFVDDPRLIGVITAVVLANAAVLGVEAHRDLSDSTRALCALLNRLFIGFFVIEIGLKLLAYRGSYFKDAWRTFDFAVVGMALLPATGAFSVLRALRVMRMLRIVSVVPSMRRVVEALVRAIPGLAAIVGVLTVMFYMGAVLTTSLYGGDHPEYFGSLRSSATTLFQLMLYDDWANIVRMTERTSPGSTLFFVGFTLVSGFAVLNLFIAVMVDALRAEHDRLEHDELDEIEERQIRAVKDIEEIEDVVRRLDAKLDQVIARLDEEERKPPS